mgnify:CR=1 FL=1
MTTLERQKKSIKEIIIAHSILTFIILAIAVVTFAIMINDALDIEMYILAVVMFGFLFLYCTTVFSAGKGCFLSLPRKK